MEEIVDKMTSAELNNNTIIRSLSYDQKEILYNIMKLHNNGEPYDCDITASTLKFYDGNPNDEFYIPEPKYLFDVYPQCDKVQKITPFNKLPLEDNSIGSIVIDLPFVISPHTSKSVLEPKEPDKENIAFLASVYTYNKSAKVAGRPGVTDVLSLELKIVLTRSDMSWIVEALTYKPVKVTFLSAMFKTSFKLLMSLFQF